MNKFLITHMATKRSAPLFAAAVQSERNRSDYTAQSEYTRNGYVPTLSEARAMRAAEYAATAAPDQFYDADLHGGFAAKYL